MVNFSGNKDLYKSRPSAPHRHRCKDHTGREFGSIKEMCKAWGIDYATYNNRRYKMKWTLERTLTSPMVGFSHPKDHKGIEYTSIQAMCRAYNISVPTYHTRLLQNMTQKEALETPTAYRRFRATDPDTGETYITRKECAGALGISESALSRRVSAGFSEAEVCFRGNLSWIKSCDHTGKEYPTFVAMCEAWGVTANTVRARMGRKWTLERALTTPSKSGMSAKEINERNRLKKRVTKPVTTHRNSDSPY